MKGIFYMANQRPDKILTVYHGSTTLFDKIDVSKGKPYKDFGCGFYVTENPNHARDLALRNKRIEKEHYNRVVTAYLYTYEFNLTQAKASCDVKEFINADKEWMLFVLANRKVRGRAHTHDVVMGPTANDDTSLVLKTYYGGLYGDIGTDIAIDTALRLIEADKLPPQIFFATQSATRFLTQKGQVKTI